jgi:hypothetical protein
VETDHIPTNQESSHVEITSFHIKCIVHFEFIPKRTTVNQAYYSYVEILKRSREAMCIKRPELWPNDWIHHHANAPDHKQFLAQKSVTEMEHLPSSPDLTTNNFWLFPKIKHALKDEDFRILKTSKKTQRRP